MSYFKQQIIRKMFKEQAPVSKPVVVTFLRLNPITNDHQEMIRRLIEISMKAENSCPIYIITLDTYDSNNPLPVNYKKKYLEFLFGSSGIAKSTSELINDKTIVIAKSFLEGIKEIGALGFTKLIFVSPGDAIGQFQPLLLNNNNKLFKFETIVTEFISKMSSAKCDAESNPVKKKILDLVKEEKDRQAKNIKDTQTKGKGLLNKDIPKKESISAEFIRLIEAKKEAEDLKLDSPLGRFTKEFPTLIPDGTKSESFLKMYFSDLVKGFDGKLNPNEAVDLAKIFAADIDAFRKAGEEVGITQLYDVGKQLGQAVGLGKKSSSIEKPATP